MAILLKMIPAFVGILVLIWEYFLKETLPIPLLVDLSRMVMVIIGAGLIIFSLIIIYVEYRSRRMYRMAGMGYGRF
jgi:hypothetical protein